MDNKHKPIQYRRCVIEFDDSYSYKGKYILRLKSISKKRLNEFIFDDQINDMIAALKLAKSELFWKRLKLRFLGTN